MAIDDEERDYLDDITERLNVIEVSLWAGESDKYIADLLDTRLSEILEAIQRLTAAIEKQNAAKGE